MCGGNNFGYSFQELVRVYGNVLQFFIFCMIKKMMCVVVDFSGCKKFQCFGIVLIYLLIVCICVVQVNKKLFVCCFVVKGGFDCGLGDIYQIGLGLVECVGG